jgi:short-subunit dehydrogenase
MSSPSYAGRTALVTGGNAGLGLSFAHQLAAAGCRLVLVARRADKLEAVAEQLRADHGVEVICVVDDLSDPEAPRRIFEATEHLQVDVLVNNAGAAGPDLLDDRDWAAQQRFFELMIRSVAHMCHHFVPPMRERGYGRVINVASVAGRVPRAAGANYGPAKAYVIAVSEELALILAGTGVNVSALCPGFTHTEFHAVGGLQQMKDRLPGWMWYDADTVVAEGLVAVERGRSVQISGRLYRWADPLVRSWWLSPLRKLADRR